MSCCLKKNPMKPPEFIEHTDVAVQYLYRALTMSNVPTLTDDGPEVDSELIDGCKCSCQTPVDQSCGHRSELSHNTVALKETNYTVIDVSMSEGLTSSTKVSPTQLITSHYTDGKDYIDPSSSDICFPLDE